MPNFPTYNATGNIDNNPVAPERHTAAHSLDGAKELQQTASDLLTHWEHVQNTMQITKAKADATMAITAQEQAAMADPNPENVGAHLKELQRIKQAAPKGITNKDEAEKFGVEMDQDTYLAGLRIDAIFKKKQLFQNDQKLDQYATTASYQKANAVSEAAGMQVEADYMNTLNENYMRGAITKERADGLMKQFKLGVVKAHISNETATNLNDSQTYKDIRANKDGLDLQENEKAMNMLKSRIKENKEIDVKNIINGRIDLINKIASGEVTWRNADKISEIGQKDIKMGEALNNVFKADSQWPAKEYKSEDEQNQYFSELVKNIFAKDTKEELSGYLTKLLDENASRNISKDRLSILINAANQRAKNLATTKGSGDGIIDQVQHKIGDVMKSISDFFKGKDDGSVQMDFHQNMKDGMEPDPAKQKAMNDYNVKNYKWVSTLPKEGKVMVDKNGNKMRWFPDGHNEDVK